MGNNTDTATHVRVLSDELSDGSVVFNVRWDNGCGGEIELPCEDERQALRVAETLRGFEDDFVSFEVL